MNHASGALVLDPEGKSLNPIDTHRRTGALIVSASVDGDSGLIFSLIENVVR